MRRGGRILVLFGIVLGIVTAGAAFFILQAQRPEVTIATTPVVVSFQSIPARGSVPPDAVGLRDWPIDSVPPGALTDPSQAANKLAAVPLFPGQIILDQMVIDKQREEERKGLGSDASFIIPPGKVAIAFPVDIISGVAGAVQSGDSVDIMLSINVAAEVEAGTAEETEEVPTQIVTQLVLQDVEVLKVAPWTAAAEGEAGKAGEPARVVTFLIDRQDALVLKYARENSIAVDLALRAAGDREIVSTEPVTMDYVITRFNLPRPTRR
ncbi:MAG: Flp pilus assembly protein CpaB [Anaerolineae bacterium]